jgi:AcrR family transcriptional regulator
MTAPTRRERLRTATVAEIKDGARRLLLAGGPQAISLRAIARDMGMTAPAIYRYFPSLDALVVDLAGDLFDELRESIERARDEAGAETPIDQLVEMARQFRRWSVDHPVEFALMFGAPVPGMAAFIDGCENADHPGARLGALFMRPFVEIWRTTGLPTPPPELMRQRLGPGLDPLRRSHGDFPVEVGYLFLSSWVRLHGLISMEVFNHLRWAVTDPEALFEADLAAFIGQLSPTGQARTLGSDHGS